MSRKVIRTISLISLINLSSKLLGIFKESAVASVLGVGEAADLFVFAVKIPRALYELFADGLAAQAMLPVLSAYQSEKNKAHRQELEASFSAYFLFWVLLIWGLCTLLSPFISMALGMGWFLKWKQGADLNDTFIKSIILLCQGLPFFATMTLAASLGVALQLRKKFISTAFLPVLVNVVSLLFVYYCPIACIAIPNWLIWGLCLSGLLNLALQWVISRQTDLSYWPPKWNKNLSGIRKFRKLARPILLSGTLSQIAALFHLSIASFLKKGSLSLLYFSQKISEVLVAALGVGVCTSLMPKLSQAYQKERSLKKSGKLPESQMGSEFYGALCSGINLTLLSVIPAMIFLSQFGDIFLKLFYGLVAIPPQEFEMLKMVFKIYILSAFAANLYRVSSGACFARHDARTPLLAGIWADLIFLSIAVSALWWGPFMICFGQMVATYTKAGFIFYALVRQHHAPYFSESIKLMARIVPTIFCSYGALALLRHSLHFEMYSVYQQCVAVFFSGLIFLLIYSAGLFFMSGVRKKHCFIHKTSKSSTKNRFK